ncbi:hypothetical protein C8R41DRAFT_868200 [Lentinula lateritia]|uniref:Uncharacterized protein n=1 Tax=Lentinula lateritia TaxID=40482 RepID=A0ABQ8VFE7_9AGAR|nr:hypothetical protein C8R41DRAFT_868200 [Lentinula lateritia]
MHFSMLFVALTTVACSLAVVANPTSVQSTSLTSRADCGTINGNCYDNGCDGDKSSDGLHCISGQYAGCPCGYGCNKNYVGPCDAFGCDGVGNGAGVEFKPSQRSEEMMQVEDKSIMPASSEKPRVLENVSCILGTTGGISTGTSSRA